MQSRVDNRTTINGDMLREDDVITRFSQACTLDKVFNNSSSSSSSLLLAY